MKRIIVNIILVFLAGLLPIAIGTTPAYACGNSAASQQVFQGIGETSTPGSSACDDSGVTTAISTGVNILSLVVGVAAVIAVILSGFKYITSGGDSNKVSNAKNTLIYALIGVAIAALAQFLVHFVLHRAAIIK